MMITSHDSLSVPSHPITTSLVKIKDLSLNSHVLTLSFVFISLFISVTTSHLILSFYSMPKVMFSVSILMLPMQFEFLFDVVFRTLLFISFPFISLVVELNEPKNTFSVLSFVTQSYEGSNIMKILSSC